MAGSIIDVDDKVNYRQELETLNYTKDKIFSIVAHDLRNPIINLKALIEMQQDDIITKEEFFEYMEKVKENVTFLAQTLDNLLKWAQSQMKGFQTHPVNVDLSELTDIVKKLHENAITIKHIDLVNNIKGEHAIYADKDHVFLAIRNIVSNAVKFTPTGGQITIDIKENEKYTDVIIRDTGVGMTAEEIEKLNDRETLFSKPGTNGEKGTGLGLTLCNEVVAENNGKLSIESEPGKGSSFIISFPKAA
jgi:signal transduction histidine kinase